MSCLAGTLSLKLTFGQLPNKGGGGLSNVRFSYWLRCLAPKWEVAGSNLLLIPNTGLVVSHYRFAAFWRAAYVAFPTVNSLVPIPGDMGILHCTGF